METPGGRIIGEKKRVWWPGSYYEMEGKIVNIFNGLGGRDDKTLTSGVDILLSDGSQIGYGYGSGIWVDQFITGICLFLQCSWAELVGKNVVCRLTGQASGTKILALVRPDVGVIFEHGGPQITEIETQRTVVVLTDVNSCARCGKDHKRLRFKQLQRPISLPGETFTHFHPCPTNGDPILLYRE